MKWRKKISNSTLVLVVVLLLGFILRFYNTPRRYGFDYDATRDALIAIYGAQTLQLPLHGPPSALGSFHFGPWYYYQLILFQLLLPFQYAPWISVSLISLVGVFFMYKLGETIGDWKLGAILALLAAISPAQVIASTGLSNPDMVFASCTFVLWVFVKSIRKKLSLWWAFWFGLMLGVGINYHFQMATFLLFPLFLLIFKKHQRISFFTTAFLGGIVSFLPLLLFNSNNNWHTVRGFFFYLREGKNAV
jgi:4-amino-4-deoxy-L-arabinose transferase-like glycosyltransferase